MNVTSITSELRKKKRKKIKQQIELLKHMNDVSERICE